MNEFLNDTPSRKAALLTLAGVGFVGLIGVGVWLAVYLSQYVPQAVGSIGSAAVSLSQIFSPAGSPLTPLASTTVSFGTGSTTEATSTISLPLTSNSTGSQGSGTAAAPSHGPESTGTYPLGGTAPTTLSGDSDLLVKITSVGYLSGPSADTFVASSTVPANGRPAVKFTIKNIGTNKTGDWNFMALIPTQSNYIFQSQPQQPLNPGESIDYTLGFDQANPGANQTITISANPDHRFKESNFDNNKATVTITVLGS